ncbi:molecular chaperone [Cronobacter dublinensis]|uniref:fimbrial biogenesis chaperone n=1 Tax=Cronobacter dublinensis TaxID=413497 RepID=UPI00300DF93B
MFRTLIFILISSFTINCFASIAVNKSRIVFKGRSLLSNEITVANSGTNAIILQSWIDDGEFSQVPIQVKSPFIVVPAVTRLNPGERRSFKIIKTNNLVDENKENLYWLNIYEVDLQKKTSESSLRVGVNTQIKVFYQPSEMRGKKIDAANRVLITKKKENGHNVLAFYNTSDYCVSLASITLNASGQKYKLPDSMDMTLMPRSGKSFPLPADQDNGYSSVSFSVVNDDGTISNFNRRL